MSNPVAVAQAVAALADLVNIAVELNSQIVKMNQVIAKAQTENADIPAEAWDELRKDTEAAKAALAAAITSVKSEAAGGGASPP